MASDLTAKLTVKVGTEGLSGLDEIAKKLQEIGARGGAIGTAGAKAASAAVATGAATQRQVEAQATKIIKEAERQAAAQQRSAEKAAAATVRATEREAAAQQKASEKAYAIIKKAEQEATRHQARLDREANKVISLAEKKAEREARAAEKAANAQVRAAERASERKQRLAEREAAKIIREAERETKKKEELARREEARRERGSFFTGHGMGNRARQLLAIGRDATIVGAGISSMFGMASGAAHSVMDPTAEFQAQLTELGLKGDMNPQELGAVRAQILSMARGGLGFSPTQAASAGIELAAAGLKADEIGAALPTTLKFAQGSGLGTAEATSVLVEASSQFGLGAAGFQKISDTYNAAANASTLSVAELAESMKYVGTLSSQAGQSISFAAGTMAFLAEQGIKGSQAGTGYRLMLASLASPARKAREAFQTLGISQKELQENLSKGDTGFVALMKRIATQMNAKGFNAAQKLAMNKIIFGQEGMTVAASLEKGVLDETNKGLKNYTDQVERAAGATDRASEAMSRTMTGRMNALKASVEATKIELGDRFLPLMEKLVPKVQDVANGIGKWAQKNGDILPDALGILGGGVGVVLAGQGSIVAGKFVETLAGPAVSASMRAAGMTMGGTIMAGLLAAVAGYALGKYLIKRTGFDPEKFGAAIADAQNGELTGRGNVRGLNGKPRAAGAPEFVGRLDGDGPVVTPGSGLDTYLKNRPGAGEAGGLHIQLDVNHEKQTVKLKNVKPKGALRRGTSVSVSAAVPVED